MDGHLKIYFCKKRKGTEFSKIYKLINFDTFRNELLLGTINILLQMISFLSLQNDKITASLLEIQI